LGDLWGAANDSRNALFRDLSPDWISMRLLFLAFTPTQNYQQVHLALYQNDDEYVQAGLAYNSGLGGEVATLVREVGGAPLSVGHLDVTTTNISLRLDRNLSNGHINSYYSLDGSSWVAIADIDQALVNPRLSIWTGGSPSGFPNCDLQRLDVVVTNTTAGSALTYQLINPPAGAGIDGNGVITWTPSEAQGPGTYVITTVVTDDGQPPSSATNSFTVRVDDSIALVFSYSPSDNTVQLSFLGVPGSSYEVEWASVVVGPWTPLATVSADQNGQVVYTGPGPASTAFFRVRAL